MRILIVDDDSAKAAAIAQVLRAIPEVDRENVDVAGDVISATRLLQTVSYTLVVLDIALPTRIGDDVNPTAGLDLLKDIYDRAGFRVPRYVVGLTSHTDIFEHATRAFSASILTVLQFSLTRDDWSAPLRNLVRNIAAAEASAQEQPSHGAFLGVVCALHSPEFDSLLRLPWNWQPQPRGDDFVPYYEGRFTSRGGERRVIAACAGRKGMASAAVLTSKLIALFRPQYVAMVGITAGVAGRANFGDVVAADVSWDWGSGKWLDSGAGSYFQQAPYQVMIDPDVRAKLNRLASDGAALQSVESAWPASRPPSRLALRVGPVASGAGVLASGERSRAVTDQHREVVGIEMEVYGVFVAASEGLAPQPKFFSLKSVVDFGDAAKNDDYQAYGAFTSAAMLRVFAEQYL